MKQVKMSESLFITEENVVISNDQNEEFSELRIALTLTTGYKGTKALTDFYEELSHFIANYEIEQDEPIREFKFENVEEVGEL